MLLLVVLHLVIFHLVIFHLVVFLVFLILLRFLFLGVSLLGILLIGSACILRERGGGQREGNRNREQQREQLLHSLDFSLWNLVQVVPAGHTMTPCRQIELCAEVRGILAESPSEASIKCIRSNEVSPYNAGVPASVPFMFLYH